MKLLTSAFCLLMVFGFANTSEAAWSFSVTPISSVAPFDVIISTGDFSNETFSLVATNTGAATDNFILDMPPTSVALPGGNAFIVAGPTTSAGLQGGVAVGESRTVGTLNFESIGRTTPFVDSTTFDIDFSYLDNSTGLGGTPLAHSFDLIVATPEPTTLLMFGAGMTGLCFRRRRR